MNLFRKSDLYLVIIYVLFSGLIIVRVVSESTHYMSPDSVFYLTIAENLVNGLGLVSPDPYVFPIEDPTNLRPMTVWSPGYPILIATFMWTFGVSGLIASKAINLICIAFMLILLRSISKNHAWIYALLLFSFSGIWICSYSWSEVPFLLILTAYYVQIRSYILQNRKEEIATNYVLPILLSAMFFMRYAGVFIIFGHILLCIVLLMPRKNFVNPKYFLPMMVPLLVILVYVIRNFIADGTYFGPRFLVNSRSYISYLSMIVEGIWREFLYVQKYPGQSKLVFVVPILIQVYFMIKLFKMYRSRSISQQKSKFFLLRNAIFIISFAYLFLLIISRFRVGFEDLNYRFFAPATFIMLYLWIDYHRIKFPNDLSALKLPLTVLAVLAYVVNLPKQYILDVLLDFLR